nr:MAG TPA: Alpha-amylase [Caudoviricetes sp.]
MHLHLISYEVFLFSRSGCIKTCPSLSTSGFPSQLKKIFYK